MKKVINYFFSTFGFKISRINSNKKRNLKENELNEIQRKRVIPWFAVNGDQTLRLNYDLDANSLVFDLGGYKGDLLISTAGIPQKL